MYLVFYIKVARCLILDKYLVNRIDFNLDPQAHVSLSNSKMIRAIVV